MPAAEADNLHAGIKGSQHVAIDGAGHMIMLGATRTLQRSVEHFPLKGYNFRVHQESPVANDRAF